jgi:hypothetical protein
MKPPPAGGPSALHGSELIRQRLADWYVESGLPPPPALAKIAEIAFALLPQGPVNVWRHVDDGSLRARLLKLGSSDPNEERVATFRPRKKGRARR